MDLYVQAATGKGVFIQKCIHATSPSKSVAHRAFVVTKLRPGHAENGFVA